MTPLANPKFEIREIHLTCANRPSTNNSVPMLYGFVSLDFVSMEGWLVALKSVLARNRKFGQFG